MTVQIREEKESDYKSIRTLLEKAFKGTDEAKLVERIRNGKHYLPKLSFVTLIDDNIIGFLFFSTIFINTPKYIYDSLALGPVAVLPEYQNNGIGSKLIMEGLYKAHYLGYSSVILLGNPDYYQRFGFEPASVWEITPPFPVPAENYMGIELIPNGLTHKAGMVSYPHEWDEILVSE